GGKDAIRRIRAILVGGLEGNGGGQWLRELERGRVVERLDVDPGEEAGRVGRLARLSERARGERRLPTRGRQCASERAGHLRRAGLRIVHSVEGSLSQVRHSATLGPSGFTLSVCRDVALSRRDSASRAGVPSLSPS